MNKFIIASVLVLSSPLVALAAPVITLTGGSVQLQQGNTYQEPGYSATDAVDGNITSLVSVVNNILSNVPGNYNVNYSVTNSASETATADRAVTVVGFGGMGDPCNYNGSCPCPIDANPLTGDPKAWKACAMSDRGFPKTADGSTLVCRLRPLMPQELDKHLGSQCAADQAGFGEMLISKTGVETML